MVTTERLSSEDLDSRLAEVGRRIRECRESAGLPQIDVAGESGVSRITLTRVENGRQGISVKTLLAIANAIGVPPEALLVEHDGRR